VLFRRSLREMDLVSMFGSLFLGGLQVEPAPG
jgi:hypothetical protein